MSRILLFLGLCLIGGLAYFFAQSDPGGRARAPGIPRLPHADRIGASEQPERAESPAALPQSITSEPLAAEPALAVRKEFAPSGKNAKRKPTRSSSTRTLKGTLVARGMPQRGGQLQLYSGKQVIGRAESNRKGDFELNFEVPAQELVLRISTRGFALLERDLGNQHVPGQQLLGNLFLQEGSALAGLVEDQDGQPLPGAEVVMSQIIGRGSNKNLGERTRSDQAGRFLFASAPNGRVQLSVSAEGFGLEVLQHFHGSGKQAKIRLEPGTSLRVKVTERDGKPVVDARLSLRSASRRGKAPRQARSNAEGIALFENLAPSEWSLHSITPGYRPAVRASIPPGAKEVSLVLVAWPRARGKIRVPKGDSLPTETEVLAILFSQRGDFTSRLPKGKPVAEDGSYELLDLRPGKYTVRAKAPGFAPTKSAPFEVFNGTDASVPDITLQRGGKLLLRVQAAGKPAAGVSAEVLSQYPRLGQLWNAPMVPIQELARTDTEGVLRINGQSPGELWLILRREGLVPLQVGPISISNGIENSLSRPASMLLAGSIRGTLKANSGASMGLGRVRINGDNARIPTQITDQYGRFKFENLPPGNYFLMPTGTLGGNVIEGGARDVVVSAGKVTLVTLTIGND